MDEKNRKNERDAAHGGLAEIVRNFSDKARGLHPINVRIYSETVYHDNDEAPTHQAKGFHLITNGWVFSMMSGIGNYCSGRESHDQHKLREDCEVAVWHDDRNNTGTLSFAEDRNYIGWVSHTKMLLAVMFVAAIPESPDEETVRALVLAASK